MAKSGSTRFYSVYARPTLGQAKRVRWTRLSPVGLPLDVARHHWGPRLAQDQIPGLTIAIRPTGTAVPYRVRPLTGAGHSRLGA